MASPPFSINEALPGDSDIVSQHPANARTFRDVVESWLLINHNVSGRHDEVALDHKADPAAPGSAITEVWASSTGNAAGALKHRDGASGSVEYVGNPPGTVLDYAGSSLPAGYLWCDGSEISRTTYARLYDAIGTTYGVGDGSTTFLLPGAEGRVIAGRDNMSGVSKNRLTGLTGGVNGDTLGATGGEEAHILTSAELAAHAHSVSDSGHVHGAGSLFNALATGNQFGTGTFGAISTVNSSGGGTSASNTTGISIQNTGSDSAHNIVQPTLILNKIIKT